MSVSPRILDWAINGISVYIRRGAGDLAYATTHDFSRFTKEEPIETMRIKVDANTPPGWDAATAPEVIERVHFHNSRA